MNEIPEQALLNNHYEQGCIAPCFPWEMILLPDAIRESEDSSITMNPDAPLDPRLDLELDPHGGPHLNCFYCRLSNLITHCRAPSFEPSRLFSCLLSRINFFFQAS